MYVCVRTHMRVCVVVVGPGDLHQHTEISVSLQLYIILSLRGRTIVYSTNPLCQTSGLLPVFCCYKQVCNKQRCNRSFCLCAAVPTGPIPRSETAESEKG